MRTTKALVLIFMLGFGSAASAAEIPSLAKAKVTVTPEGDSCPKKIAIELSVNVPAAGTYKYRMITSNGTPSPESTLNAAKPGVVTWTYFWTTTQTLDKAWVGVQFSGENTPQKASTFSVKCPPIQEILCPATAEVHIGGNDGPDSWKTNTAHQVVTIPLFLPHATKPNAGKNDSTNFCEYRTKPHIVPHLNSWLYRPAPAGTVCRVNGAGTGFQCQ